MTFGLSAALLDACVLAVLSRGDTYGYILTQNVREVMDISDSTLYPVLRRLQKDGYLTTYDQPFQGRNRRYYSITEQGHAQYQQYITEWVCYKHRLDKVILGGIEDDQT
ncbi:PadR family transcriptional regulator [Hydrogenoanaerobacterium sp.]|uniref:PadR family transcriptional regulator n=1 Tax=Hydrogenoanaerobacterium sp. TaxID=2953763 RepID=UPI00289F0FEC|nr:PadR family transcriptional regulator [Hydrogenoanaerobacterium sp.]